MDKIVYFILIVFVLNSCGKRGDIIIKNKNNNPASIDEERIYKF